ncbi:MAG: hypothetical protein H6637_07010 [Ardenticatenales bacterium]|nr:hypothetical protein [Ardenticatenales bacterium]
MTSTSRPVDASFPLRPLRGWGLVGWLLANTVGFATMQLTLLALLGYFVQGEPVDGKTVWGLLMVLILVGLAVAVPQWLILQWRQASGRSWLWSATVAWSVAIALVLALATQLFGWQRIPAGESAVGSALVLLCFALVGLGAGVGQALLLRWPARRRWRWAAINALAMVVAAPAMLIFVGGLGYGVVTAWAMQRWRWR